MLYLEDIEMSECLYVHECEVKKNVKFAFFLNINKRYYFIFAT
jgi:hypothetical protein